jgi:hypothetical protein
VHDPFDLAAAAASSLAKPKLDGIAAKSTRPDLTVYPFADAARGFQLLPKSWRHAVARQNQCSALARPDEIAPAASAGLLGPPVDLRCGATPATVPTTYASAKYVTAKDLAELFVEEKRRRRLRCSIGRRGKMKRLSYHQPADVPFWAEHRRNDRLHLAAIEG